MATSHAVPPSAAAVYTEKTSFIEDGSASSNNEVDRINEDHSEFSPKEASKIRRRIDLRLIPALGLMYGVSLMDRKNVSNAYIAGMKVDLDLEISYRYSLITLTFFITYVIFQAPMTYLCRKIGPPIL